MGRPETSPLEPHYSISEIAKRLGVSRTFVKEALARRELGFRKLGTSRRSRVLIPESEARAWLERTSRFFPSADAAHAALEPRQ